MNHVRDFKDHLKYFFSNLNEEGLTLWLQAYHQLENMTYILTLAGKICNSLLGLWNLNVEIQNPFSVSRMPSLSQLGKWLFSLTVKKKKKIYYGYMRSQLEESFSCINYIFLLSLLKSN